MRLKYLFYEFLKWQPSSFVLLGDFYQSYFQYRRGRRGFAEYAEKIHVYYN